ncbi:MAG: DUF3592 domain-containing protein [Acidobacteriota bacterium]
MQKLDTPTSSPGVTFSAILAGPLALIGTALAFVTLRMLITLVIAQSWPTVPAIIQSVELQNEPGTRSSQRLLVTYVYKVNGQTYTSHRFSVYTADNLGTFRQDALQELSGYRERQQPYPAHVNPRDPSEAILKPVLRWEALGFYLVFVTLFGGGGWAILISSYYTRIRMRKEAELIKQFPDQPWKHRVEWVGEKIPSLQKMDAIMQTSLAVVFNLTSFPVLLVTPREVAEGHYWALTFLVVPLFGIGLIYWSVVSIARARRFGKTWLKLETLPARPGEPLQASLFVSGALDAQQVNVVLRCEHSYKTSNSKTTRTVTEVVWKADANVPVIQSPDGAMVVITMPVPKGFEDSARGGRDEYDWLLSATAPLKGADFAAEFSVPVFAR